MIACVVCYVDYISEVGQLVVTGVQTNTEYLSMTIVIIYLLKIFIRYALKENLYYATTTTNGLYNYVFIIVPQKTMSTTTAEQGRRPLGIKSCRYCCVNTACELTSIYFDLCTIEASIYTNK